MIIEIREYVAVPGRFAEVVDLFTQHTAPNFARQGMELVDVGKTLIGDDSLNELVYALRFRSLADMEARWAQFFADPEWLAASHALEARGPLLQTIRRRVLDATMFGDPQSSSVRQHREREEQA